MEHHDAVDGAVRAVPHHSSESKGALKKHTLLSCLQGTEHL